MQDDCAVKGYIKEIKQTNPKCELVMWSKTGTGQAIGKWA